MAERNLHQAPFTLTDGRSFCSNKVDLITRQQNYIFFWKKKSKVVNIH